MATSGQLLQGKWISNFGYVSLMEEKAAPELGAF
jgi:hypothetical protein